MSNLMENQIKYIKNELISQIEFNIKNSGEGAA